MSAFIVAWLSGLGAALALMVVAWSLSIVRRDASVVDAFWGAGFALLAWVYLALAGGANARKILIVALVTLWGVRLSAHILWRSRGRGEDYRYRQMRERQGDRFAWVSLFTVFLLQGFLLWMVSVPLLQAQAWSEPASLTWLDALGAALFLVGLVFETVGDLQLARFRADVGNRGKVLDRGLWRYTRHPNYFGDAVVWWGLWLIALATPGSLWTVYSPLLMTFFLTRVSGVTLLEKNLAVTKPAYAEYVARTHAFVPWFPRSIPRTGARS